MCLLEWMDRGSPAASSCFKPEPCFAKMCSGDIFSSDNPLVSRYSFSPTGGKSLNPPCVYRPTCPSSLRPSSGSSPSCANAILSSSGKSARSFARRDPDFRQGYTTLATLLQRLAKKGYVAQESTGSTPHLFGRASPSTPPFGVTSDVSSTTSSQASPLSPGGFWRWSWTGSAVALRPQSASRPLTHTGFTWKRG